MSELKRTHLTVKQERAILVGVILPDSTADPRDPLGELASLAKTAGAKVMGAILQIELAQLQYASPRLVRMWGHLERIAGSGSGLGIGARGPGEPQLETDRRLVRKRISDLKSEISKIQERKTRLVAARTLEH